MNLILIPFFLAANVLKEDTSKWTFGPEYTYDVDMTRVIRTDAMELIGMLKLTSTMKCRPKMSDSLLCYIQNSTLHQLFFENGNATNQFDMKQFFEIKFNREGVQSLLIDLTSRNRLDPVYLIRNIANQFSLGVDIKQKIDMSQFTSKENTSMGNCATTYKITREKPQRDTIQNGDTDFQFVVSPIIDEIPETRSTFLTIDKSRIGCVNSPQYLDFIDGTFKMERFFSKICLNGINGFETYSEIEGKLMEPAYSKSSKVTTYKGTLQVNLNSVKPAQDQFPLINYGGPFDLNTNSDIP